MKRTRVTDSITFLEPDDMRLFQACAGVMVKGARKLVIDANMGPETTAFLQSENPEIAIISHYHLDHGVWGATAEEYTQAQVWVPAGEEPYLTNLDYFLDHTAGPHGLASEWRDFSVAQCGYRELQEFTSYDPGVLFSDHHVVIECLDTHGHSPAHRSFYFPNDKVLFTGDLGVDRFGPWYGWSECNLQALVAAILSLRQLPVNVLLTSHGGILTKDIDRAWNLTLNRLVKREKQVATRLEKGFSPDEIISEGVFFQNKSKVPEPMQSFLYMWDTVMFRHHREIIEAGGLLAEFPELAAIVKE